ncbi:MAG: spore coat associated protein CotJA [Clostridia bacterium]|nr:spore coat associated protein CotJA [Clostridia bacterium]
MPIGMAYVPWQSFRDLYEKDKAIMRGTIFAELDKPFKGAKR